MKELEIKLNQASYDIIDQEAFEQGIDDVVTRYKGYTVTASTIKDDKKELASLRKLAKQISDKRIEIKNELTAPVAEFEAYVKQAQKPLQAVIDDIAKQTKEVEEHAKALRLDTVKSYIANKVSEYLLDPRLFDEKALEYIKVGDFMADGVTLKKATMKSLDDLVTFEVQKQQQLESDKQAIAGLCAEYGLTDQPYLRMLETMTVSEVLGQVRADHDLQVQKAELEARRDAEIEAQRQRQAEMTSQTLRADAETGEVIKSGELSQNQEEAYTSQNRALDNIVEKYTQTMELKVFFKNTDEKDHFKRTLEEAGFVFGENYWVSGYRNIEHVTPEALKAQFNK